MATRKPVEVVEFVPFEQRTSKTKPQRADAGSKKESVEERKELNFQEAWKDVHKLGMHGRALEFIGSEATMDCRRCISAGGEREENLGSQLHLVPWWQSEC